MSRSFILGFVILFACGGDDGPDCVTSADCMLGLTCVDGRCMAGTDGAVDTGMEDGGVCPAERSCRGGGTC